MHLHEHVCTHVCTHAHTHKVLTLKTELVAYKSLGTNDNQVTESHYVTKSDLKLTL